MTAHFVVLIFCHAGDNFNQYQPHPYGVRCPSLLMALVPGESASRGISCPRAKVILLLILMRAKDSQTHLLSSVIGAQRASLKDWYFWDFPLSLQQHCYMRPGLNLGVVGKIVPYERGPPSARHLHYGFVPM